MNLAIDAGGTNLRAEIWNDHTCIAKKEAKSVETGLYAWIETLLGEFKDVRSVGISFAGQVQNGIIVSAPNILIDEHDIKKAVEAKYGVTLNIDNDLNCAVLAETKEFGAQNICALYVGTGIGLGAIERGVLIRGFKNVATEIGHIPYKKAPFLCGCGRNNCLELYASGSGIAKWIEHKKLLCDVSLHELERTGESEIVDMFHEALLSALGTTLTLFNPQVLVLGGGIIDANPYLENLILENIKNYTLSNSLENVTICKSKIKNAPIKGALLLKDYND